MTLVASLVLLRNIVWKTYSHRSIPITAFSLEKEYTFINDCSSIQQGGGKGSIIITKVEEIGNPLIQLKSESSFPGIEINYQPIKIGNQRGYKLISTQNNNLDHYYVFANGSKYDISLENNNIISRILSGLILSSFRF